MTSPNVWILEREIWLENLKRQIWKFGYGVHRWKNFLSVNRLSSAAREMVESPHVTCPAWGENLRRAGLSKTCSSLKNKFRRVIIKWNSSEKKCSVWLQVDGAAPLPGQQQRPLSYDSASTCGKEAGYFLDVSHLLTKPDDKSSFFVCENAYGCSPT